MENCDGKCEAECNCGTDAERHTVIAKELLGTWMAVVHHISGCDTCWPKWIEVVTCMEEAFNETLAASRRSNSEQSEDVVKEVPPIL